MKKIVKLISVFMLSAFVLMGCGDNKTVSKGEDKTSDTAKEISFVVPDGLPAIAVSKLIKENPKIKEGYTINYSIEQSADGVSTAVMKGTPDIAIVPSNLAAIAFNKNGEYEIAGTTGWGSFYVGAADGSEKIEDLRGKEVYNIGKGLTPDIIARTLCKDEGINTESDVNFTYVDSVAELAPIILSGKAQYAVIPEPALSTVQKKNSNFKVIADLNEEWKRINNSEYGYPQATLIVKKDLVENDKEFLTSILKEIQSSTSWIYDNKEEAGTYCEEIGITAKKPVVISAIDRSNIKYVSIKDSIDEYKKYYEKLNEFDSSTVGGKVPDEQIFMEK